MIEVADIFRQHAGDYINQFGQSLLPSHLRALQERPAPIDDAGMGIVLGSADFSFFFY